MLACIVRGVHKLSNGLQHLLSGLAISIILSHFPGYASIRFQVFSGHHFCKQLTTALYYCHYWDHLMAKSVIKNVPDIGPNLQILD